MPRKERRSRFGWSNPLFFAFASAGGVITFVTGPVWLFLVFLGLAFVLVVMGSTTW